MGMHSHMLTYVSSRFRDDYGALQGGLIHVA